MAEQILEQAETLHEWEEFFREVLPKAGTLQRSV